MTMTQTDASAATLFMVRALLDAPGIVGLVRRRRLPLRDLDAGYIAHCALDEIFGPGTLRPFFVEDATRRQWSVLGYASDDASALTERARSAADPALWNLCDWRYLATKPMPSAWPTGARLSFRVRACPIQRMASDGEHHRKGAEVDVFLARSWAEGSDVALDRSQVYSAWLERQISKDGAAHTASIELEAFRRSRLLRRSHGATRTSASCERPDVQFRGTLEVADSAAFGALVERGVGRHRGFGFGMLRLAHPQRAR